MAFAGLALGFNAGMGLGAKTVDLPGGSVDIPLGVTYSRASVGVARLIGGFSLAEFYGASIGPSAGSADVKDIHPRPCCDKAGNQ
jgi:hypothetical protein